MSTNYDNEEVPLVLGSLRGRRNFKLDWQGFDEAAAFRLQSPLRDYLWKSGENAADCVCGPPIYWGAEPTKPFAEKQVAAKDHTCGFYAYTNHLKYEYESGTNAIGVIEGYGRITVGDLGFRAAKAKILAVNFKEELGTLEEKIFHRYYPDIEVFTDPTVMFDRVPLVGMQGVIKYPNPSRMARAFRMNRCPECANILLFEYGRFVCRPCEKEWKASYVMDTIHNNFWGLPG